MPVPTGPRSHGPTRRQFLTRAAILAASRTHPRRLPCGVLEVGAVVRAADPDARLAGHPVKWEIADDNKPIADGLAPEKGATLQLYNYADYTSPDAVKSFEDKYGVQGRDLDVQRHRRGDHQDPRRQCHYDLYFPSYDQISRLVGGQAGATAEPQLHPEHQERVADLHQPLVRPGVALHRAVHHLHHRHRLAQRPGERPTSPALQNPYDVLWDPQYNGKTAVIDDWHTAMAMVLLQQGITDVNTSSEADLKKVGDQLKAMVAATSPKVTITMYNDLPAGQLGVSQMWSGDIINAQSYLPEGTSTDILQYWFPSDGKGLVDNDLMVVLQERQEPGARPPVHQPHARAGCGHAELHRHRLPAAAELDHRRIRLWQRSSSPRTCARRSSSRSTSTPATGCSNSTRPTRTPGSKVWQAFNAGGS